MKKKFGKFNFNLREGTNDERTIRNVLNPEEYFNSLGIKSVDRVLDIGMHLGSFSVGSSDLGAKVFGYEPDPDSYNMAIENFKENNSEVEAHMLAVGSKNKKTKLYHRTMGNRGMHTTIPFPDKKSIDIKSVCINDVLEKHKPNKIKIDCEGGEYEIIKSIKDWSGIEKIVFELHTDLIGGEKGYKEIEQILKKNFSVVNRRGYQGNEIVDCCNIKIPRLIHIIWVGPKPFPYEKEFKTWEEMNPEWDVILWTDENLPELHNKKLYDAIPYYTGKADILRIELLAKYGGLYTDADSVCLKPIEPLIKDYECFAMTGNAGDVSVAFMGCTEGHKAFVKLRDGFTAYVKKEMKELRRKTQPPMIHMLGTWYVTKRLRANRNFVQIERGKKRGTRKLVVTKSKEVCEETYVQQLDGNTWRDKLKGRRFPWINI